MDRHPRLFTTFFMKQNPLDGTAVSIGEKTSPTHIPLPARAENMPPLSSYVRDTHEFEVETNYMGDTDFPNPEETARNQVTYGLKLDELGPALAQKYTEARKFWDTYFDLSNKEWGKPEETKPRILYIRKHSDYVVFRSEVIVNAPIEEVIKYLNDDKFNLRIDPRKKSITRLREVGSQCSIYHMVNNGNMMVSERDMLLYRFQFFESPDCYRILNIPAEDSISPPAKGTVRADMKIMGVVLTRVDANTTKMENHNMINPKAPIPMFMVRGKVPEMSLFVVTIKNEIEKGLKSS